MTVFSPTITFSNADTASFRAWGKAVSDALFAVGLVKHTDTGQIDWTTATLPTTINTSAGYEIWRLNDAQHGAGNRSMFMRIQYGTADALTQCSIWTQFSNATNGAGGLVGLLINSQKRHFGAGNTVAQPCYFASDGTYLTMLLAPANLTTGSSNFFMNLHFDRTRDPAGLITPLGFQVASTSTQMSTDVNRYSARPHGGNPFGTPALTCFSHAIFSFKINQVGQVGDLTGGNGSYTGTMPFQIPIAPGSLFGTDVSYYPQMLTAPDIAYSHLLLAGRTVDMPAALSTLSVPVLGAPHTFLVVPIDYSGFGIGTIRMLARYE